MLSVLSYNILFGRELNAISDWLKNHKTKFDILCFQEFPKDKIKLFLYALKNTKYEFKFGVNFIKNGKQYGELTLINTKKIQLLTAKTMFLGTNIVEDKIIGLKGERSALITKLKYKNKTIILSNTHLISYALNSHRRSQLIAITEYIDNLSKKEKNPTIILGDLNYSSIIWQHGVFKIMERKGFKNSHKEKTHKLLSLKYQQLDYVFYKNCKVLNVEILKLKFSDHFPVVFKLKV